MSPISVVLYILLGIIINTPIAHINRFVEDLPITTDHKTSLTPPQLIKRIGYPAESHTVQTADGYLLELHRIPYGKSGKNGKKRIPVLLVHGLLFSSSIWIVNTPKNSIAFRLADEGYDVWMANLRGTAYSSAHIEYTTNQKQFWDFSYPEMAKYDLPAAIDYVLGKTEQHKLFYIAHSLGAYSFFVMASTLPKYNDKIIAAIAMAPATAIPHTLSPLFRLSPELAKPLQDLWEPYSSGSFFQRDILTGIFLKYICPIRISGATLCEILWFTIWGGNPSKSRLSEGFYATMFGGISVKLLVQDSKFVKPGTAPPYDYSNIQTFIKIYHGDIDPAVTPKDVKAFYRKLPANKAIFGIPEFGHLSYFTDLNTNERFLDNLLSTLRNCTIVH